MPIGEYNYQTFDLGSVALSHLKAEQTRRARDAYAQPVGLYLHPRDWQRWLNAIREGLDMRKFRVRWGWGIVPEDTAFDWIPEDWSCVRTVGTREA